MHFSQRTLVPMFQCCSSYSAPPWSSPFPFSPEVSGYMPVSSIRPHTSGPPCSSSLPSSQHEQCAGRPQVSAELDPREYLSQTRTVQAAMIHSEMLNTSSTVPGQMVMRVFMTKRVLKLILLRAPMLRDEASVKSLLCSSMTRAIRYRRRNMGMDRMMSTSASAREGV